ncbi:MAG: ATP-binding cassette domain-containing protein [Planctomycetes bacterium]|nr:ATP-binding cassette domain-containing protein [Planctomycetota bacterium]
MLSATLEPQPINRFREQSIGLNVGGPVTLGNRIAEDLRSVELAAPGIEMTHCLIVRQPNSRNYWLVENRSTTGTFVNSRPVVSALLAGGDLIQVGPFAWIFNSADGFLVPVRGVRGVHLELREVRIDGRLGPLDLSITPGEMVAVVGPSGAGKSTLISAIVGGCRHCDGGTMLIDSVDTDGNLESFRSALGYVSQHEAVHTGLRARQAVWLSAKLRGRRVTDQEVDRVLHQVDLSQDIWGRTERSGGEAKRLRTAAELIAEPRLLVLDEPASGLDPVREEGLLRLLRSLSLRGCTVISVTHNLSRLETFDRVVVIGRRGQCRGQIVFDGPPAELKQRVPTGDLTILTPTEAGKTHLTPPDPPLGRLQLTCRQLGQFLLSAEEALKATSLACVENIRLKFAWLAVREVTLTRNDWLRRLVLPVILVPAVFAAAIGIAAPAPAAGNKDSLLGFLCILACIWMGASLSLMSIVHEREVVEHERLLFLRFIPYVMAKASVLWLISMLQTTAFLTLLWLIRPPWSMLPISWTWWYLMPAGLAAVGMGLLISALAGHSRQAANVILPLVMMFQIVFSVQIAGMGNKTLHAAYLEFSPLTPGDTPDLVPSSDRPNQAAAWLSYLTISRYADIELRSLVYFQGTEVMGTDHARWRWRAWSVLWATAIGLPLAACGLLWLQELKVTRIGSATKRHLITGLGSFTKIGRRTAGQSVRRESGVNVSDE